MRVFLCPSVFVACLAVFPALAYADTFLAVQGVGGDATDAAHKGWIRVASLDWEVRAPSSYSGAGGAGVGKPVPEELKLTLPGGPWSSEILRTILRGQPFAQMVIDHVGSDGRPQYRARIDGFLITQYKIGSQAKSGAQGSVEGVFRAIRFEHYTVGADGKTATSHVEWNVLTGVVN